MTTSHLRRPRAAALTLAALPVLLLPVAARAADTPVDKRIAAEPNGTVALSNVAGMLAIEGWDNPEVHVTGTLGAGVERVDVQRDGARVVVKVVLPRGGSMRAGEADRVVKVPAASKLEVSTVSAEVETRRVGGAQRINSVSGNLGLDVATAPVEVKTVSGDVTLRGGGGSTTVRLSSVSGDVRIERLGGELEANTVSGDLQLALGTLRSLRLRSTSGDLSLRGALERDASLEAESVSGDLDLRLAAAAGFDLDAESFSGDIATCYGARGSSSGMGPGNALRSKRGDGGARLRIKTMSGDIQVCDR